MLQRVFKIGFNRAAVMDQYVRQGSWSGRRYKAREKVHMSMEQFEQYMKISIMDF